MANRFSWIAGIAAIGLAFWQLTSLLRDSTSGAPWQSVLLVAILLGSGITWTALAYRAPAWLILALNVATFVLLTGFIISPDTLFVILPTTETWSILWIELVRAVDIFRHSLAPVRPVPGLVVMISFLFWTLGSLLTAGLVAGRPFLAVITPLIVAVQFSIIDHRPASTARLGVFLLIVILAFIATRGDEQERGTGRLARINADTPPSRRPTLSISLLALSTVTAGVIAVNVAGDAVPSDGFTDWRAPAGFVDGFSGSAAFNPFTDIHAGLISPTDNPLFIATIEGIDPTAVRFRTVTLDVFRNGRWATDRIHTIPLDTRPWIDAEHRYRGETVPITVDITIQNLTQPWLPAPSTPNAALAPTAAATDSLQVRRLDGSLFLPGDVTYTGMTYSVQSDSPKLTASSIGALARTESGDLSPLFQAASDAGRVIPEPAGEVLLLELSEPGFWTDVPDDLGPRVRTTALRVTDGLETNFERALALEHYFRMSGQFVYELQVPPEFATGSVEAWLTDEENPFVRHGYCEQFATAMALMGRAVGIPSRVVLGFTAGTPVNSTTVQVLSRNAHAWVEMWVPQFGWMAFDPTPRSGYAAATVNENISSILGFSAIAYEPHLAVPAIIDHGDDVIGPESRITPREPIERVGALDARGAEESPRGFVLPGWAGKFFWLMAGIGLLVSFAPGAKWLRRRRNVRRIALGDVASAWHDITDRLTDLGEPFDPAATPLEAAASIDEAFLPLAQSFGEALYGEYPATTQVIERTAAAHSDAIRHMTTRYSRSERAIAILRPTWLFKK